MILPYGYYLEEKYSQRVLYQDVEVFRPKLEHDNHPIKEADRRMVASFSKEAKVKDIERVATKDLRSQAPEITSEERVQRMRSLVSEFWLTEVRL